jgi:hypothetical protein
LKRPVTVAINEHSGLAGIAHWVNSHFKLKDELVVDKKDELVAQIKKEVDKEFEEGRTTSFGDDELELIVRQLDEEKYIMFCHHLRL